MAGAHPWLLCRSNSLSMKQHEMDRQMLIISTITCLQESGSYIVTNGAAIQIILVTKLG